MLIHNFFTSTQYLSSTEHYSLRTVYQNTCKPYGLVFWQLTFLPGPYRPESLLSLPSFFLHERYQMFWIFPFAPTSGSITEDQITILHWQALIWTERESCKLILHSILGPVFKLKHVFWWASQVNCFCDFCTCRSFRLFLAIHCRCRIVILYTSHTEKGYDLLLWLKKLRSCLRINFLLFSVIGYH